MSTTEKSKVQGTAILADSLASDGPWAVRGVAIGPNEVTVGMSGQKKYWPSEALADAADTLAGKNLVKNHVNNDVDAVVGAVSQARYHPDYGVIYEGEVDEEGLARKIDRGRLDVSPRIIHKHVDELEENEDGALVVDEIQEFVNLALVPQGAAESNEIELGESDLLSVSREDLSQAFGDADGHDAEADDPGADEVPDVDDEIEDPVQSGEESAQASGAAEAELGCDCDEDCDCDGCDGCEECAGEMAVGDDEPGEAVEESAATPDDDVSVEDDAAGDAERSVLHEIEVLGVDSQDDDVDLTDIEILTYE